MSQKESEIRNESGRRLVLSRVKGNYVIKKVNVMK